MAKLIKDLAVKTGEYTNAANEIKGRWLNVGKLMQSDDGGHFLILNRAFNPAGVPNPDHRDTVLISMFDPKSNDRQPSFADPAQQAPVSPPAAPNTLDDEIPF